MDREEEYYRKHEKKHERKRKNVDADLRKLVESVFDHSTFVYLLQKINKGDLKTVEFVLSTGKEANVYYGKTWEEEEVALKIFRIAATDFKKRQAYIQGDRRFHSFKSSQRKLIYEWTGKEYKNLSRMYEVGIPVPKPIWKDRNLLLMDFIGKEGYPAPLLKDAEILDYEDTYKIVINGIRDMVDKAKLVHGDLSAYNIIYFEEKPIIIDVSQAVVTSHPMAREFLIRDIINVNSFFVSEVNALIEPRELFTELMSPPSEMEKLQLEERL